MKKVKNLEKAKTHLLVEFPLIKTHTSIQARSFGIGTKDGKVQKTSECNRESTA